MSFANATLGPGESVTYVARISPFVFVLPMVLFVPSVVLLLMAIARYHNGALLAIGCVAALLSGGLVVDAWIRRRSTEIIVTNFRLLVKTGVLRVNASELLCARIQAVQTVQSALDRAIGRATFVIHETGVGKILLEDIGSPSEFRRALGVAEYAARQP